LIAAADRALYSAKAAGRNRVHASSMADKQIHSAEGRRAALLAPLLDDSAGDCDRASVPPPGGISLLL